VVKALHAERWRQPVLADLGWTALRAFRSLVVIGVVALGLAVIRDGAASWPKIARIASLNRTLFLVLFLGLWVWEFWYRRARRQHTMSGGGTS
jgi:hypothetical protein